jgi:hypothetical protein
MPFSENYFSHGKTRFLGLCKFMDYFLEFHSFVTLLRLLIVLIPKWLANIFDKVFKRNSCLLFSLTSAVEW